MSDAAYDVAIVGAGMAGLAAAERLRNAGLSVAVLEARPRLGGRAFTDTEALGAPFDLGAQWLHTGELNPLMALVRELDFAPEPHDYDLYFRVGGRDVDVSASRARFDADLRAAGDIAVSEAFALRDEADRLVTGSQCTLVCATDPDRMSTAAWVTMIDTGEDSLLADGLGAFVARYGERALSGCTLHLNCPVTAVDWRADTIRLRTDAGDCECRTALLTVPTGVLATAAIRFDPPLPEWKQSAIEALPMGRLNKIGFRLDDPVDGLNDGDALTLLREDGNVISCLVRPLGVPWAMVFVGGRFAAELEEAGRPAMLDYGRSCLAEALGGGAAARATRAIATGWSGDPWCRGSYATPQPGQAHRAADMARQIDHRLYFAGDATETVWAAQLAGAWRSGRRAAEEIVAALPR